VKPTERCLAAPTMPMFIPARSPTDGPFRFRWRSVPAVGALVPIVNGPSGPSRRAGAYMRLLLVVIVSAARADAAGI